MDTVGLGAGGWVGGLLQTVQPVEVEAPRLYALHDALIVALLVSL
jgi:hypothetical protein